ncbi:MAG: tol-pal system-associated acyl-CoA thioesterase [Chromatiales bacterium]|nr:tol-pal system-associated acyl-CoA thioesterase [Chromatiales bacterium]
MPLRVYYEDTDAGGVVYYARYLQYMERARTEWLRARGLEQTALRAEHGILFAVRDAQIRYRRPARLDDELRVSVRVDPPRRASLVFHQRVSVADSLCVEGVFTVACVDADAFTPCPIPESVRNGIIS